MKQATEFTLKDIDYKNPKLLQKFLGKRFAILSKKYTGVNSKMQRKITTEIKKARIMGLLKYTDRH